MSLLLALRPLPFRNSRTSESASNSMPRSSLTNRSKSRTYLGALSTRSLAWPTTIEPAAAKKIAVNTSTPPSTRPVALPRRHPRRARRSTAGSIASDRKNATRIMMSRVRSRPSAQYAAKSNTTQPAASAMARLSHGGTDRSPRGRREAPGSRVRTTAPCVPAPCPGRSPSGGSVMVGHSARVSHAPVESRAMSGCHQSGSRPCRRRR